MTRPPGQNRGEPTHPNPVIERRLRTDVTVPRQAPRITEKGFLDDALPKQGILTIRHDPA